MERFLQQYKKVVTELEYLYSLEKSISKIEEVT